MFAALNIDRNNITNAVSDNMLDDLGITRADYVSPCLRCTVGALTDEKSLEHWSNHLSGWISCRRAALSVDLEANWPGPLDSYPDLHL